jgi:hypothetical protein
MKSALCCKTVLTQGMRYGQMEWREIELLLPPQLSPPLSQHLRIMNSRCAKQAWFRQRLEGCVDGAGTSRREQCKALPVLLHTTSRLWQAGSPLQQGVVPAPYFFKAPCLAAEPAPEKPIAGWGYGDVILCQREHHIWHTGNGC